MKKKDREDREERQASLKMSVCSERFEFGVVLPSLLDPIVLDSGAVQLQSVKPNLRQATSAPLLQILHLIL
jgi:hypothetical protein